MGPATGKVSLHILVSVQFMSSSSSGSRYVTSRPLTCRARVPKTEFATHPPLLRPRGEAHIADAPHAIHPLPNRTLLSLSLSRVCTLSTLIKYTAESFNSKKPKTKEKFVFVFLNETTHTKNIYSRCTVKNAWPNGSSTWANSQAMNQHARQPPVNSPMT